MGDVVESSGRNFLAEQLYSPKEVANMLGVETNTVREWLKSKKLKGIKIGDRGQWRIPERELNEYLKEKFDA